MKRWMTVVAYLAGQFVVTAFQPRSFFLFVSSQQALPCIRVEQSTLSRSILCFKIQTLDKHTERNNIATPFASLQKSAFWKSLVGFALATTLLFCSSVGPAAAENVPPPSRLPSGQQYWSIIQEGRPEEKIAANTALLDYAVGTINTMYYDFSGGAYFQPRDFYILWKDWLRHENGLTILESREGAVEGLKWLVAQLNDPFSSYLTKEQLRAELQPSNHGFLGLGVIVKSSLESKDSIFFGASRAPVMAKLPTDLKKRGTGGSYQHLLDAASVAHLPVVTAVLPDSPAERAGLVVGDRIMAVGEDTELQSLDKFSSAENYFGYPDLTIAKPVYAGNEQGREVVVAYRPIGLQIPTLVTADTIFSATDEERLMGGNAIVHYEVLRQTIFDPFSVTESVNSVGYIRLTRFSKAATAGFIEAVEVLEKEQVSSYIIDLRNNYGGVIQEAMLTASSLLRDPHAVLCYTLNSRGGFTPHDVEEYVVDKRYPGYLLSSGGESKSSTMEQVQRESPEMFDENGIHWVPPSSFASLREQRVKRGIQPASRTSMRSIGATPSKNIVLLINEGTASSAEVFASALRDNGRTIATIGTRTFGKGLIQHTFPMPDGGGLRLTVAEYLTPALKHVTFVGGARYDRDSGEWVSGGIRPDILCPSRSGIPRNIGADFCVGEALDALDGANRPIDYYEVQNEIKQSLRDVKF